MVIAKGKGSRKRIDASTQERDWLSRRRSAIEERVFARIEISRKAALIGLLANLDRA